MADDLSIDDMAAAGPLVGADGRRRRGNAGVSALIAPVSLGVGQDMRRGGFVALERTGPEDLDAREKEFARNYVLLAGDGRSAAERAGYANPPAASAKLLERPVVLRQIRDFQEQLLQGEAATVAISTVLEVMRDRLAKPTARISAARLAAEMAGLIGPKAVAKQAQAIDNPEQIVMAELAKAVKNLSAAGVLDAGRLGPIVDVSPVDAPQTALRSDVQESERLGDTTD